jgi:hypothetical protein
MTQKILRYAGIGSRQTPHPVQDIMTSIGQQLADRWMLRSGHAEGADQAFETGVLLYAMSINSHDPNMEIFIPYNGFNGAFRSSKYILVQPSDELKRIARHFHPAWERCTEMAKYLHMRNVWEIAGQDLNTPVDMVVCWTLNGKFEGGTGQALRMAQHLNIPIFNLAILGVDQELCDFIQQKESELNVEPEHSN